MEISEDERRALRYYDGEYYDDKDPFFFDPKAYVTFNSLFFDGIAAEHARADEGRHLNAELACQYENIIGMAHHMIHACRSYDHGTIHTYRVERLIDYEIFKRSGMLESFISTSKNGFLNAYEDKHNLVLMELSIEPDALCCDLQDALDGYGKPEEAEVLIAPYAEIEIEEVQLSEAYRKIRDGNGKQPCIQCCVRVKAPRYEHIEAAHAFDQKNIEAVHHLYHALNMHAYTDQNDVERYLAYKKGIKEKVMKEYDEEDLQTYLLKKMQDPAFRAEYEKAMKDPNSCTGWKEYAELFENSLDKQTKK